MSDQILSDLLDRSVDNVPTSEPPVVDVLRRGRAIKRRRRRAAVVGPVVASLIVVGAVVAGQRFTQRAPQPADQPTSLPALPAGMKWVGVGRMVVAIPQGWPVVPGIYCQGPIEPYVTITQWRVTVGCMPMGNGHGGRQSPAAVDIEGDASGDFMAKLRDPRDPAVLLSAHSTPPGRLCRTVGWPSHPASRTAARACRQ